MGFVLPEGQREGRRFRAKRDTDSSRCREVRTTPSYLIRRYRWHSLFCLLSPEHWVWICFARYIWTSKIPDVPRLELTPAHLISHSRCLSPHWLESVTHITHTPLFLFQIRMLISQTPIVIPLHLIVVIIPFYHMTPIVSGVILPSRISFLYITHV